MEDIWGSMAKRKFGFSANDKEWHQTLLNAFENILGLKVKPVIMYDRKQFKQYLYAGTNANSVWAECIKESGTIWLSPHLATNPKVDTVNTLYHECLHIKYPKMREERVRNLADDTIPVASSSYTKKKSFDRVHIS